MDNAPPAGGSTQYTTWRYPAGKFGYNCAYVYPWMGARPRGQLLLGRDEQSAGMHHQSEALRLIQDTQRAKLEWLRANTELVQLQIGLMKAAMRPKDPPPGMFT